MKIFGSQDFLLLCIHYDITKSKNNWNPYCVNIPVLSPGFLPFIKGTTRVLKKKTVAIHQLDRMLNEKITIKFSIGTRFLLES